MDREKCEIENTSLPMTKEELAHAFDLFYHGDKSRSRKKGHMGMGLFLARKILGLHGKEVTLEPIEDGVRVEIR